MVASVLQVDSEAGLAGPGIVLVSYPAVLGVLVSFSCHLPRRHETVAVALN